ncbi:phosphoenolpyruvate carboxylase [Pirellulales bacterium]|nr:phosphoenolpyruvate carboxylase [Pirellulales bacterium]
MPPTAAPSDSSETQQPENRLREEIAFLGEKLGETIEMFEGADALELVERLRRLAWERRRRPSDDDELQQLIGKLDHDQFRVVIRAFTIFLDLVNLAEDRQRVRVLRERKRAAHPEPPNESVRSAIERLRAAGVAASEVERIVDRLNIELVFTSHPTEAKRTSIRRKLRRLRELVIETDGEQTPSERETTERLIESELAKLWQTDFIRPWRPSIMQEVRRGLSMKPVLWNVAPQVLGDLRNAIDQVYSGAKLEVGSCLRFGSWIGGDRDGHPGVTPEVTEQTIEWLRNAALKFQLRTCSEIFESLSLSQRQVEFGAELNTGIYAACEIWPELDAELATIPPNEVCRRWIRIIHWRLRQTECVTLDQWDVPGAYRVAAELRSDVTTLLEAVSNSPAAKLVEPEVWAWLDQIETFGLHLARLDVRQDARQYRPVMDELLQAAGLCREPALLSEVERQAVLIESLNQRLQLPASALSPQTHSTVELFRLLHRVMKAFGPQALGGHVISMTHAPSDILAVLWLWKQTAVDPLVIEDIQAAVLPIIPLFETIEDLQHGPQILQETLAAPVYRDYVRQQQDHQIVMLGYSDSTKDGGYLSACWSLFNAQRDLFAAAEKHHVHVTFFHGRGGSLGRGGGPAARSILSLPAGTFQGSLRLTEQGEVLADRYDDPEIAYRHLEQLVWSSLLASSGAPASDDTAWRDAMQRLSETSFRAYRNLVEQPGFVEFFRSATPIAEIEQLPIGSRPSRRTGANTLADLRAIPWVFSWTQCRCLIPAWYGLGSAVEELAADPAGRQLVETMYREWPFFRATIDNAELAIAKADLGIAQEYARLAGSSETVARVHDLVTREFERTRTALLGIAQNEHILEGTPWLRESIRVRNRYIDPLNLIQVELLRRRRACTPDDAEQLEELRHLTRLTINGLASGMRTTG